MAESLGSVIRWFGGYSILITTFMAGFAFAAAIWSSSNTKLQADLQHIQEKLQSSDKELSNVTDEREKLIGALNQIKSEYNKYREENPPKEVITQQKNPNKEEIVLQKGKSYSVFGGDLYISLIEAAYNYTQSRYIVNASLSSQDYQTQEIYHGSIGDKVSYGDNKFDITILEIDSFSAKFLIARKGS